MNDYLFIIGAFGLIFPAISLVTGIMSLVDRWVFKRHNSPVFVPFIGPLWLSVAIAISGRDLWLIPVVWIADVGTVAFFWARPRFIAEWWALSRFTRILTLEGSHEDQSAVLTLHSSGEYLLKKKWQGMPGHLTSFGTFTRSADGYELVAHFGLRHTLRAQGGGLYVVNEEDTNDPSVRNYSLKHWHLRETNRGGPHSEVQG